MKMNGSLLLMFVFKHSGVQHEADGLQTEKEMHRWWLYQRMKVRVLPSEQNWGVQMILDGNLVETV